MAEAFIYAKQESMLYSIVHPRLITCTSVSTLSVWLKSDGSAISVSLGETTCRNLLTGYCKMPVLAADEIYSEGVVGLMPAGLLISDGTAVVCAVNAKGHWEIPA